MADQLTAADIKRLALANLAQRAAKGDRLSPEEWARLESFEAAERPDPLGALLADLTAQAEALRAEGKRPTQALLKLAREALLREIGQHVWADVPAAAKELGVSVQTVRNWCDEAGIAHQRTAISRADLYRALYLRAAAAPAAASGSQQSEADAREQELRMLERQARIDERTQRLVLEANDAARSGLMAAVRDLRSGLAARLPAILADAFGIDTDRLAWERRARQLILDHLPTICAALTDQAPDQEPQP